jgi:hypothetical protein
MSYRRATHAFRPTYYWRVKTTAGNNPGVVSPTTSFTVGPLLTLQHPVPVQLLDVLTGASLHDRLSRRRELRYTLKVQWPSVCLTRATITGAGCGGPGGPNGWGWANTSSFSYDGTLSVAGDALQMSLASTGPLFSGEFRLTLQRSANRLTGSVSGNAPGLGAFTREPATIAAVILDGSVTGNSDNHGRFTGSYDGTMGLWKFGFPCDVTVSCATSGFTWTLTSK